MTGNRLKSGFRKERLFAIAGTLLLLATAFYFEFFSPNALRDWVTRVDGMLYDVKVRATIDDKKLDDPPIIIVDIDETSLKAEGRWPWSRIKVARLIDRLAEGGTMMVSFDVVFSEHETNAVDLLQQNENDIPLPVNEWLMQQRDRLDADSILAASFENTDIILGTLFHESSDVRNGQLLIAPIRDNNGIRLNPDNMVITQYSGYSAPIDTLLESAIGTGAINTIPDNDGVIRRTPLLIKHDGKLYPSLALEAARQYLLEEEINIGSAIIGDVQTMTHATIGGKDVPTDAKGNVLVPYRGKAGTFQTISATSVLHDDDVLQNFDNAIVLLGTSALALADLRPTPLSSAFPGVEIQASILNGLLHPELLISEPDWLPGALALQLIFIGIFMVLLMPHVSVIAQPALGIALAILAVALNYWLWISIKINMPLFTQISLILAATAMFTIESLVRETHEKLKIRDSFGQYVPPEHIDRLQGGGWDSSLRGERREMTVLFSDIRSFTQLSEGLDASQLREFLNIYLTPITKIIFSSEGTIDKYVGDMVMAFWNAPLDDPEHASHAVHAALEMQTQITTMQSKFHAMGLPDVAAGIGIHTGEMNVGDMGSEYRRAYTVLGDAVNLGSRLESITKFYGAKILVSGETKALCTDVIYRYIDCVRVKGKESAVKLYEPLCTEGSVPADGIDEQLEEYNQGIAYYLDRQWENATAIFSQLTLKAPEVLLYQVYLERCEQLRDNPPGEDWNGIYTHTTK